MGMFDAPAGWEQSLLASAQDRKAREDAAIQQADPLASLKRGPDTMFHDPQWQAFFEAMGQQGVNKMGGGSLPTSPAASTTAFTGTTPADVMQTPDTMPVPDSMYGLMKASGGMVNDPKDVKGKVKK